MNNVTQNRFDKFFSGSELIVAGKLQPSDLTTLQSLTTAAAVSPLTPLSLFRFEHALFSNSCFAFLGQHGPEHSDGGRFSRLGLCAQHTSTFLPRLCSADVGLHDCQSATG